MGILLGKSKIKTIKNVIGGAVSVAAIVGYPILAFYDLAKDKKQKKSENK